MIIPYKYAYLVGTVIFFIPWFILYFARKDWRKEMLFMSIGVGIASFITAYLWWTVDWWQPETITETIVGIEDVLLGFANGGVAAVLYEGIFKKRIYKRKTKINDAGVLSICAILFFIIFLLFWILSITSFWASTIAMIVAGIYLVYTRRDLFFNALASGFLMALVSLPVYYILMWLFPGFIKATWLFHRLSGITITGIPVEDLVFYFLFGFIIGPLYEYWQNKRLRSVHAH